MGQWEGAFRVQNIGEICFSVSYFSEQRERENEHLSDIPTMLGLLQHFVLEKSPFSEASKGQCFSLQGSRLSELCNEIALVKYSCPLK